MVLLSERFHKNAVNKIYPMDKQKMSSHR